MKLYHWYSKVLSAYSDGDIVVMAESVEQARDKVYAQFKPLDDDNPFEDHLLICLHQFEDADYADEYDKKLSALREDLNQEPTVIENGVVCIRGSD
jgi:CobQ-like glutamine amidotransferase family enzyme